MVFFLLINTAASLNPIKDEWIMRGYVERDIIQHYTGWLFYRDSHIPFPIGVAKNIGYPSSGAIAFSDSIPVMSLFFGLFSNLLPNTFQFFGLYTLLCYMLLGASGSLLLSLFFNRFLDVILGTILFSLSPIMIERAFRHTALASHYLIIFALYLYFCNRKNTFRMRWGYTILCFLSVTIHFYFVPMVLAVLFADLLQNVFETGNWKPHLCFLGVNILSVFIAAYVIGYFYTPTVQSGALGYGYFTMNLNAIFNPSSISGIRWSLFLPQLGQGWGSAEGFNYLGLGVLVVLLFAAVSFVVHIKKREFFILLKTHRALFIVLILLTLFAVSTTVIINNNPYLRLQLPLPLLRVFSIFRSSGRMFWPVFYILMLFAVCFLKKRFSGKILSGSLILLVIVQILDLSPAFIDKHHVFTNPVYSFTNPVNESFFINNKESINEIFTFSQNGVPLGMYISHYAVTNNIKTNEPFMARNDIEAYQKSQDTEFNILMAGNIPDSTLYIFDDTNRFFTAAMLLGDTVISGKLLYEGGFYYIISSANRISVPEDSNFIPLNAIPLTIADYSDLSWQKGVLTDDPSIVTFYDNSFTSQYLKNAEFLIANGEYIKIIDKNYHDPGWVIVSLDIDDASFLVDTPLLTG